MVYNPGTTPDDGLYTAGSDVIVAFESDYSTYQSTASALSNLQFNRTQYSFIVHSVPASANTNNLVDSMAQHAKYLFVTDQTIHDNSTPYSNFGSSWSTFVGDVHSS